VTRQVELGRPTTTKIRHRNDLQVTG